MKFFFNLQFAHQGYVKKKYTFISRSTLVLTYHYCTFGGVEVHDVETLVGQRVVPDHFFGILDPVPDQFVRLVVRADGQLDEIVADPGNGQVAGRFRFESLR